MPRIYIKIIIYGLLMFAIVYFVKYMGNNTNAFEKAPVLHGKGKVEKVEFIPEHDQTVTYRRGRTKTYHVADAYSVKVKIDGEDKTGTMHTYSITEGEQWKEGDEVNIEYKKVKTFFFMPTKIYITSVTKQ